MMIWKRFDGRLLALTGAWNNLRRSLSGAIVDEKFVVVQQDDGRNLTFPGIWLRDNCQCSECFHQHTKSRTTNWQRTNVAIRPEMVQTLEQELIVRWTDHHQSTFHLNWLRERDFSAANRKRYIEEIYKPALQLWQKAEYVQVLRTFQYDDVMAKDAVLLAWLETIAVRGFALIHNAPHDVHVSRRLAERIGFIKRTTYGEVFEVKSKEGAQNYAYLMTPLPLHTDMPYYEYKAGINILHCLVQSKSAGGANLMTDGFYIAEHMRRNYPEHFNTLLTTPVNWYDIGMDLSSSLSFHSLWRAPVICLNTDGEYQRINQNTTKRDSHFTVPLEQVEPWYAAYDKFLQLANSEAVEFKTAPGDVFTFNNLRMLHGRTAYEDSAHNQRHLIGGYVDWDIIYSKIRTLKYPKN